MLTKPGPERHFRASLQTGRLHVGMFCLDADPILNSVPPSGAALEEAMLMAFELDDLVEYHKLMRQQGHSNN